MALPSEAHIVLSHIRIDVDEFLQDAVVTALDAGKPRRRPGTHRLRVRTIHRIIVAGKSSRMLVRTACHSRSVRQPT